MKSISGQTDQCFQIRKCLLHALGGKQTAEEIGKSNFGESGRGDLNVGFLHGERQQERKRERERRSISRSITPRPKVYEEIWSRESKSDQCASSLLVTMRKKRADYEFDLEGPIQKASVQQNFQFGKQFTFLQYLKKFSQSVDNSRDYIFNPLQTQQLLFTPSASPINIFSALLSSRLLDRMTLPINSLYFLVQQHRGGPGYILCYFMSDFQ